MTPPVHKNQEPRKNSPKAWSISHPVSLQIGEAKIPKSFLVQAFYWEVFTALAGQLALYSKDWEVRADM